MGKSEKEKGEDELAQFTSNATRMLLHQIASPLVSIRGHISNILSGRLPEEVMQKRIIAIDELIQHALREMENFKVISEIHSLNPNVKKIDIDAFLKERRATFLRQAVSNDLEIVIQIEEIGEATLETDYSILSLAVDNLIDNAIKYSFHRNDKQNTDKNHSRILINSKFQDDKFKLSITNWGYRIDPQEQNLIFSKFFRGKNAIGYSGAGNGIGLFITQKCIESLGGVIEVFSKGHQTTFTLTLKASTK